MAIIFLKKKSSFFGMSYINKDKILDDIEKSKEYEFNLLMFRLALNDIDKTELSKLSEISLYGKNIELYKCNNCGGYISPIVGLINLIGDDEILCGKCYDLKYGHKPIPDKFSLEEKSKRLDNITEHITEKLNLRKKFDQMKKYFEKPGKEF